MKRLLIILFCLPLLFACQKEEIFEEGQEVVLNLSVDMGDMQSVATRAMGDNVEGTPALWLAVFDGEGYLVEWTKAFDCVTNNGVTTFKATLHATMEKRVMHFLLNYVDDSAKLELNYGHENNVIGGLIVERNRDVYWQRVELPEGINGSTDQNGTVKEYLTKVPLVRNFSKIKVTEACDHFELLGFYVLNVPKRGTVAPFINGSFVKYYNENAQFNGASFTPKTYATLNTEGYTGTMPDNDERINKHTAFTESMQLLNPTDSYYLYESTYINGNKDKTVSVLLKGNYDGTVYWYRVDLVKPDAQTGVIEYFDVLRNFAYTINITHVTAGKKSAKDAIEQPAGNNILSSLDIAHLTNVSDGKATLEVNYTDTVLISNDAVTVRYKFTDTGSGANDNSDIANKSNECGWYLTYDGQTAPVEVAIAGSNSTDDWRDVTIRVKGETIIERKEVSITFFATSSTQTVLSRTVHYTLMPQQPMRVECPELVPATVGSEFNVNILIPDELPEAMFPLDFAIESQAAGNTSYLAQYITPANSETVSVKTDGSIVDIEKLKGKKSFQYVVTLSYEDYKNAVVTERTLSNGQTMSMRLYPTLFKTNTAQSASTVYAYNRYFTLGKDEFENGNVTNFTASFTNDNTATYGIGRTITLNLTAGDAGKYIIETTTLQVPTRAPLAELTMTAGATQQINLITSTFAEQAQVLITCEVTGVSKVIRGVERNTLNAKAKSLTYNGQSLSDTQSLGVYKSEDDAVREANRVATSTVNALLNNGVTYTVAGLAEADLLYFSYSDANNVYVASAKASDLSANSAELKFEQREVVANITDITLSGDKYYGENKALTLKFTTDRPGVYTITLTEGGESITQTYNVETAGTKTINQDWLKTQTWSDQVTVTISGVNAEAKYESNTERNTIKLGKLTFTRGSNNSNVSNNASITISNNGEDLEVKTHTALKNGTDLIAPGLTSETDGSFKFRYTYNYSEYESTNSYSYQDLIVNQTINLRN